MPINCESTVWGRSAATTNKTQRISLAYPLWPLFQRSECGIIIGFSGDLIHQLAVKHFVMLIQYDNGTGRQTLKGTISNFHAKIFFEFPAAQR
ncbi:Hypothetical Protein PANA_2020 [Pantoea ananatis LMG 20103]|uniref:Uncharacterized protein n=1 Tax=Pantoea ananatis (strain LMG 20103) TaxID=706191 RepID=D4GF65_PANAM|nr:Hypothetical Protein PANA_2020 [Pantoea ananatis LMG 20103]